MEASGVEAFAASKSNTATAATTRSRWSEYPEPHRFGTRQKKAGTYKIRAKGERVKSALGRNRQKPVEGYKVEAASF